MRAFGSVSALLAIGCISAVSGDGAFAQTSAQQPVLNAEQAIQLFEAAGFAVEDGQAINRCGGASSPRVAFVDLNGDRRAEAHIADVDPLCYGQPGAYFAILAQQADGRWKRLIAEDGIVGFARARTAGWNDLTLDDGDSACPGKRIFDGDRYSSVARCSPDFASLAGSAPTPAAGQPQPLSQELLFDWTEDQTPEARALGTAVRSAIFETAGVKRMAGGKWSACTEDESGFSEAQVAMFEDLNGDGRPEALIRDGGTFCNGAVGVSSTVLTQGPDNRWEVMFSSQGFVNFLVSRGADNFPDIEVGLQFSCFPYFRWNGAEYAKLAQLNRQGQPCSPF